jgi:very-short-patch-repair endonuclease
LVVVRPKSTTDRRIARLATRSHGVVTRAELLRAGITDAEIKHRLSFGALFPEHRGVYRVGHRAPSVEARYLAAVRACGARALLSGPAAAHLWGIAKGPAPPPEVTTPVKRMVKGVVVRRRTPEGTVWRGIPITTVPQTLVDLAATFSLDGLARACHEAGVRYGTTPAQVKELLRRQSGAAKLRAVMDGDAPVTLSRLEKRFLERLEEAGLPRPITNRPAGTKRVDCRWPEHRLTVELDSYSFHNSRHSWEQDRLREREARQRGDAFLRFTQADLSEPAAMLADITRHTRGSR